SGGAGGSGGLRAARPVRGPAQRDGPALVQALVDPDRAGVDRAQHVRARRHPGADPAAVAVATAAGERLVGGGRLGGRAALGAVRGRLAAAGRQHVRDQPLRPVRPAAGGAAGTRARLRGPGLPGAAAVPDRPASADGRGLPPVLGHPADERWAGAVRGSGLRLHPGRGPVRGARPAGAVRRVLPAVRGERTPLPPPAGSRPAPLTGPPLARLAAGPCWPATAGPCWPAPTGPGWPAPA